MRILLAMVAMFLTGCGLQSNVQNSQVASSGVKRKVGPVRSIGVESIDHQQNMPQPETIIQLNLRLGSCSAQLETFSADYRMREEGIVDLYVSAMQSWDEDSQTVCAEFPVVNRSLTVPGSVRHLFPRVHVMMGSDTSVDFDTYGFDLLDKYFNFQVRRMCQEETACYIDGTEIEMEVELPGCLDSIGPQAYHWEFNESNKTAEVWVAAVAQKNPRSNEVQCYIPNRQTLKFAMVNTYVEEQNLAIKLLK